ncbi:MAG TPA: hypothetical protein VML95_02075 [Longimicrobiales bacterium]|nr:hypothetical protein [Longimicrobiales bacterium]
MRKSPWHSVRGSVHHVCSNCNTGNNIVRPRRSYALHVVQPRRLEEAGMSQEKCGCLSKGGVVVASCENHRSIAR